MCRAAETDPVEATVLMRTMGHSDEAMTGRYQKRKAAMSGEQAEVIERAMFLRRKGTRSAKARNTQNKCYHLCTHLQIQVCACVRITP